MKKFVLAVILCSSCFVSAAETTETVKSVMLAQAFKKCVGVESDCGGGGIWFACGEPNPQGYIDWELIDEMRQLLNEAFCDY